MNATRGFTTVWRDVSRILLVAFTLLLLIAAGAARAADAPGKKIFLERKCHKCHTLSSEGVSKVEDPDEEEEEEEETDDEPPDLSGVGEKLDAEKMDGWLRKKLAIEGDKHPKRFAGSDAERKILIDWLRQTKPAPKTGAKTAPTK